MVSDYYTSERASYPEDYVTPSWSWASVNSGVTRPNAWTAVAKLVDIQCSSMSESMYGHVSAATLMLKSAFFGINPFFYGPGSYNEEHVRKAIAASKAAFSFTTFGGGYIPGRIGGGKIVDNRKIQKHVVSRLRGGKLLDIEGAMTWGSDEMNEHL
jgi:hypothetical protein